MQLYGSKWSGRWVLWLSALSGNGVDVAGTTLRVAGVTTGMSRRTVLQAVVGFLLAAGVLLGFLVAVGFEHVVGELAGADPRFVLAGVLAALAATLCWSEAQRRVLDAIHGDRRPISKFGLRFRLAYLSGDFAKQTLPLGHVSGPAIMAWTVGEAVDLEYDDALAAITVSDLLNLTASILLAGAGLIWFLAHGRSPFLDSVAIALAFVVLAVAALAVLVFRRRPLLSRAVSVGASLIHWISLRVAPTWASRSAPQSVRAHVKQYYSTLDRVTAERRPVAVAAGFALAGWVLFTIPLWTAGRALGVPISIALVLFVVPVAGLATWIPLPGGLGGVEVAVAAALVGLLGIPIPGAAAIALVYRLCSYWAVVVFDGLGGLASLRVG